MNNQKRELAVDINAGHFGAAHQRDFDTMSCSTRNKRVYKKLKKMGLYVIPVYETPESTEISYLLVSCGDYDV